LPISGFDPCLPGAGGFYRCRSGFLPDPSSPAGLGVGVGASPGFGAGSTCPRKSVVVRPVLALALSALLVSWTVVLALSVLAHMAFTVLELASLTQQEGMRRGRCTSRLYFVVCSYSLRPKEKGLEPW